MSRILIALHHLTLPTLQCLVTSRSHCTISEDCKPVSPQSRHKRTYTERPSAASVASSKTTDPCRFEVHMRECMTTKQIEFICHKAVGSFSRLGFSKAYPVNIPRFARLSSSSQCGKTVCERAVDIVYRILQGLRSILWWNKQVGTKAQTPMQSKHAQSC